ncbi:Protein-L-isoaspartate O-methyltransferase [Planctomycetales bacterium 10988]|nr:Protein-L-isoaspartate O-methyltransferase [Planctomycetales bacterium 10988]
MQKQSRKRDQVCGLALTIGLIFSANLVQAQALQVFQQRRHQMVAEEVAAAGVENPRVLESMRNTPRHEFVPFHRRSLAYYDMAVPIGHGQTISPPFVVAYMTEQLDPQAGDKVLEIGTGSGYQAAVLSPLVAEVYSIEIVEPLGKQAARTLKSLRYQNVHTKVGDGFLGWPEEAPFDKIIVTCSPERVPRPLVEQLKEGGRLVVPLGERYQQTLYLYTKKDGELVREGLRPTLFVPMTGRAEELREVFPEGEAPAILNGGFEEAGKEEFWPKNWHYLRRGKRTTDPRTPHEDWVLEFENNIPGRGARAVQAFALDGSEVSQLLVTAYVRCESVRQGQQLNQRPAIRFTYYDEEHQPIGEDWIGPWFGTFDWAPQRGVIKVPRNAKSAIVTVGLLGGVGKAAFDGLQIQAPREKRN